MDLSHRNIVSIDPDTFRGLNLLVTIRLDHNSIREIQAGTFQGLRNLTTIYLNFNNIARLSSGSFNDLRSLIEINLNRNSIARITEPSTFRLLPVVRRINFNGKVPPLQVDITAFNGVNQRVQLLLLEQVFNLGNIPAAPVDQQPGQAGPGVAAEPVPGSAAAEPVPGSAAAQQQAAQQAAAQQLIAQLAAQPAAAQLVPVEAGPYVRLCEICMDQQVNCVLPCGHPLCLDCYNDLRPSHAEGQPDLIRCPTCRRPAPEQWPLFLGGYKKKYLKYKEKYIQLKNQL
jgi:Leucine-rich repeat (LRR) protein